MNLDFLKLYIFLKLGQTNNTEKTLRYSVMKRPSSKRGYGFRSENFNFSN